MVDAITTAIYELTVKKVASYSLYGRFVSYASLSELRQQLTFWESRLTIESTGGDCTTVAAFGDRVVDP